MFSWEDAILLPIVVYCVHTDFRQRRIRNIVVYPLMAFGLGLSLARHGLGGLPAALLGMTAGLMLLPFYAMGGIGAGDVKLVMAIGLMKGFMFTLQLVCFSLFTSVLVACIGSPYLVWLGFRNLGASLRKSVVEKRVVSPTESGSAATLVYSLYILCGLVAAYLAGGDWSWLI